MPEARDNRRACADANTTIPSGAVDHAAAKFRALAQLCDATGVIGRGGSRIARQALGLLVDLDLSRWELSEADHLVVELAKVSGDVVALERPLTEAITVLREFTEGLREPRQKSGGDADLLALVERFYAAEAAWREKQRDREGGHEATDELLALSEERRRLARDIAAVRSRTRAGAKAKAEILATFMDVGVDGTPALRDERDVLIWSIGVDLGADAPRQPVEKAGG
jgi:hypothetical protein